MTGINFGSKASIYERSGLVQKRTSGILLDMMNVGGQCDVLDLGCGPGGATNKIAALTNGRVLGVDLSPGMIEEARHSNHGVLNLDFEVRNASELDFSNEFDRIFCNSAFQWFTDPDKVVAGCYRALKPGGLMGIQAPATSNYCPVFLAAVQRVAENPQTRSIFSRFRSPYFFLESAQEYANLFAAAGFQVITSEFVAEENIFTVDEAYGVFQSGAENGYLNRQFYDAPLDDTYIETCRRMVRETFEAFADAKGVVELNFTRVHLLAKKPE